MNEAEYILSIILRARDQAATAIASVREQVRGMAGDSKGMSDAIKGLNTRMDSLNAKLKTVEDRFTQQAAAAKKSTQETEKSSGATEAVAAAADKASGAINKQTVAANESAKASEKNVVALKNLDERLTSILDKEQKLGDAYRAGTIERKLYIDELKRLGSEYDKLAGQAEALGVSHKQAWDLRQAAINLRTQADKIVQIQNDLAAQNAAVQKKIVADRKKADDDARKAAEKEANDRLKAAEKIAKAESEAVRKALEKQERDRKRASEKERAGLEQRRELLERTQRVFDENADTSFDVAMGNTNRGTVINLRNQISEFQRLSTAYRRLGEDTTRFDDAVDRSRTTLAGLTRTSRDTNREMGGLIGTLAAFSRSVDHNGTSVASLDNQLRGMGLLLAFGWAQQLISAMVALGGTFVSVASSAAMAGSAIGGAMMASAAQSIPAIGLVIASLARLKSVMDVVQQSQQVEQQQFHRNRQAQSESADQTNRMADAQDGLRGAVDGLSQAHERVRLAQEGLNQARAEAVRQLQDLIFAEREAELAAQGAVLSQEQAQDALRSAVASGDTSAIERSELAIAEATQRRASAEVELTRAHQDATRARRGGVDSLEGVVNAERQLRDARRSVGDAERSVVRAQRGIQEARRGAQQAATDTFAAASALDYMLSQLSPAERDLYRSIQRVRRTYEQNFRPITDIFVGSFTRGVNTVNHLLKDRRLLNSAKETAEGMVKQFDRIRIYFTQDRFIRQFLRIMDQARENLKPLGDIVINLGQAFANISEDAGPALAEIVDYLRDISERILAVSESESLEQFFLDGAEHVKAWGDALWAAGEFFFTLIQLASGEGKTAVSDLTSTIERGTAWLRDPENANKIQEFFRDAREVTYEILRVLWEIGQAIMRVFDADSVKELGTLLTDSLLPALETVVEVLGSMTQAFAWFINNVPFANEILAIVIAFTIFAKTSNAAIGLIKNMAWEFARFLTSLDNANKLIANAFDGGVKGAGKLLSLIGRLIAKIPGLNGLGSRLGGFGDDIAGSAGRRSDGRRTTPPVPVPGAPGAGPSGGPIIIGPDGRPLPPSGGPAPPRGGGPIILGPDGRPLPPRGGPVPPRPAPSRTRSVVKGLGIASIVGGGLLAHQSRANTGDLEEAAGVSQMDVVGQSLVDLKDDILSADIAGLWNSLTSSKNGVGDLAEAAANFDENLKRMTEERNVAGLDNLADHMRDVAESHPQFADALNNAAQSAEDAARAAEKMDRAVTRTDRVLSRKFNLPQNFVNDKRAAQMDPKVLDDIEFLMRRRQQGIVTDIGQIRSETTRAMNLIAEQFGTRSSQAKSIMARNLMATVEALREVKRQGGPAAKEAAEEINKHLRTVDLLVGNDPIGTGRRFARKVAEGKGDRQGAINAVIEQLAVMPKESRQLAAESAIQMARELVKKGELPKGAAKRLASDIGLHFRELRRVSTRRVEMMAGDIGALMSGLGDGLLQTFGGIGGAVNKALDALGVKKVNFSFGGIGRTIKSAWQGIKGVFGAGEDLAIGGFVGKKGERGPDVVRTNLGRGEAVLNWIHQPYVDDALREKYGFGLGGLFQHVKGYHAGGYGQPGYAAGGYVQGAVRPPGGEPSLIQRLFQRGFNATSAFRPGSITSSGNVSNHSAGNAWDFGDSANNLRALWNLLFPLRAQLAELGGPSSVSGGMWYNNGVGSNISGTALQRQHEDHIHIAILRAVRGALRGGTSAVAKRIRRELRKLEVNGPRGALRDMAQGALDRVIEGANKRIRRDEGRVGGDGGNYSGPLDRVFPSHDLGAQNATRLSARQVQTLASRAGLPGWFWKIAKGESGFYPGVIGHDPNGYSHGRGLYQITPEVQSPATRAKLSSIGNYFNPWDNTLMAKWMLSVAPSKVPNTPGFPWYGTRFLRFGGGIPGYGGGDRHATMLEGGEHVITKEEVRAAGGHAAIRALRRLLGGGGQGGPLAFAAGGEVGPRSQVRIDFADLRHEQIMGDLTARRARAERDKDEDGLARIKELEKAEKERYDAAVKDIRKAGKEEAERFKRMTDEGQRLYRIKFGQYEMPDIVPREWDGVMREVRLIISAVNNVPRKLAVFTDRFFKSISALTDEDGVLDTIGDTITRRQSVLENRRGEMGFGTRRRGLLGVANRDGVNIAALTMRDNEGDQIRRGIVDTVELQKRLRRLQKIIADGLGENQEVLRSVNRQIGVMERDGEITDKERENYDKLLSQRTRLQTVRNNLLDRQIENDASLNASMQEQLDQQRALIEHRVGRVTDRGDRRIAGFEQRSRMAQVFGQTGRVFENQRRIAGSQNRQADALQDELRDARRMGDKDLAQQIRQQIRDLRASAAEGLRSAFEGDTERVRAANERQMGRLDTFGRIAQAFGNEDWMAEVNRRRVELMEKDRDELTQRMEQASAAGYGDIARELEGQINDLNTTIIETSQQMIQATVDQINNAATRRMGRLDRFDRMLNAVGAVGLGQQISFGGQMMNRVDVMRARGASMEQNRAELTGALSQAQAAGNVGMARDLQEQIEELTVAIQENSRAIFQARIEDVNSRFERQRAFYDRFGRMLDALGAVGLDQMINFAGQAMTRRDIFMARGVSLEQQRRELQQLLIEAQSTGDMQFVQDLTDQLSELDITIQENTRALFQARIEDVNSVAQYGLSITDLRRQIIELTDQLEGTNSQNVLESIIRERGQILQTQRTGLQQLLADATAAGDQQAIQDLTRQLLENELAILQNTQSLKEVTGQLNWQTFSSIGWRMFRQAIFTGMGAVMPQYEIPGAANGAIVARSGLMRVHEDEAIIPAVVRRRPDWDDEGRGVSIDYDLNIHQVRENADPVEISQRTMFELSRLSR